MSFSLMCFRTSCAVFIFLSSPATLVITSDRVGTGFAGADADRLVDGGYENLAVADATRLRGLADRLDGAGEIFVGDDHLDLHLRQEVDDIFRPPVKLSMPLLAPEPLGFEHRDSLHARFLQ